MVRGHEHARERVCRARCGGVTMSGARDSDGTDAFAHISANEHAVEAVAARSDALGATARVVLAVKRGDDPTAQDVAASHFDTASDASEAVFGGPTTGRDT